MEFIAVFVNGSTKCGSLFKRPGTLEEFVCVASENFEMDIQYVFTTHGVKIETDDTLKESDILYVSEKMPFIPVFKNAVVKANHESGDNKPEKWVRLNVGGVYFTTTQSTLCKEPDSMLAKMFQDNSHIKPSNVDKTGAYLIDRDPVVFRVLLNYLRNGNLSIAGNNVSYEEIRVEADYFGLHSLPGELHNVLGKTISRNDLKKTLEIDWKEKSKLSYCLKFINFTGCDLRGFDLSGLNLSGACFRNCTMFGVILKNCDLEFADFQSADLSQSTFENTNLSKSNLQNAFLVSCTFRNCDLSKANLCNTDFSDACLDGCCFESAVLDRSQWKSSKLVESNFLCCSFIEANLLAAKITKCDFRHAHFLRADLRPLDTAQNLPPPDRYHTDYCFMKGCNFNEADFSEANLFNVILSYCNLINADLSGTDMRNVKLNGCTFDSIRSSSGSCSLLGAVLRNANLQNCNLSYCCLKGAILKGANLEGVEVDDGQMETLMRMTE